jgi:hypothetical protein
VLRGVLAERSVRLHAGALLALLACALLAPADAQAGCASYVVHGSGRVHLAHFLDPSITGGTENRPDGSTPADSDRPRPCSGPSCSGNSAPPLVPPVSETRIVEPWACLGDAVPLPGLGSRLVPTPESDLHPVLVSFGVFHPPRATAPLPNA